MKLKSLEVLTFNLDIMEDTDFDCIERYFQMIKKNLNRLINLKKLRVQICIDEIEENIYGQ